MTSPRTAGALVALLAGLIFSATAAAQDHRVANFELKTETGESWSLSEYDGQPKLVMFWATWCPYCKRLFPRIQSLHEEYEAAGLKVVAISIRDKGDQRAYRAKHGLTMDILVKGDSIAQSLEVPGTPAVILLNGENEIVYGTLNSDPDDDELPMAVKALMQSHAETQ